MRLFVVRRLQPGYQTCIEEVYVHAHMPLFQDDMVAFQVMVVDPVYGVLTRTTRAFSSWIDVEMLPMSAEPRNVQ